MVQDKTQCVEQREVGDEHPKQHDNLELLLLQCHNEDALDWQCIIQRKQVLGERKCNTVGGLDLASFWNLCNHAVEAAKDTDKQEEVEKESEVKGNELGHC
jgi:hypothetical protein